jgi:hypothetical protein
MGSAGDIYRSKSAAYVAVIGGAAGVGATLGPVGAIAGGAIGAGACAVDYIVNEMPNTIEGEAVEHLPAPTQKS